MKTLFVTPIYQSRLDIDAAELEASCLSIAEDDEAGQKWCEDNDFPGYTSYASLTDLPWRFPIFQTVKDQLDQHVAKFAEELAFDLDDKAPNPRRSLDKYPSRRWHPHRPYPPA